MNARSLSVRVRLPLLLASLVIGGACSTETPRDGLDALFADELTVVDLTHTVSASAPYWPGPERSPFRHDTLAKHADSAPSMAAYALPEHFGTHLDAPVHFGAGQASVDEIPITDFFGPAVVIDVSAQASADADYVLTADDVLAWEARHGRIPAGSVVLMRSGWAARWSTAGAYFGRDDSGGMHFPGFAADAARLLVEERDIAGIGVDTGSVDPGNADGFPVHDIVNGSGRYHLENVANLERLPESGAFLIVAPVKIEGGSGGQVRVYAVLPDA